MGTNIDLSLLRRPLTPFTGFQEAKNAFDKGTAEVRHLLLFECGLIYECNICRNMFRSLANFISHKRVFCCTSSKDFNGTNNLNNGTDGMHTAKQHTREFRVQKHEMDLRQKIIEGMANEANKQSTSNQNGSIGFEAQSSDMNIERTNQDQNHNSFKFMERKTDSNARPTEQLADKSKEISNPAYIFQCPSCSLTFLKSSAVIRHLAIAHNIPIRRIRMMRDSILKCRADPPPPYETSRKPIAMKPKNREQRSLQLNESSSSGNEEKTVTNGKEKTAFKCYFCQKSFERRAALVAHTPNCPIKTEMHETQEQEVITSTNDDRIKTEINSSGVVNNEAAIAADVDCEIVEEKQVVTILLEEEEDVKQTFADLQNQSFGTGLRTVSLEKLDMSAGESTNASLEADNNNDNDAVVAVVKKSEANMTKAMETKITKTNDTESNLENNTLHNSSTSNETLMSIKKRRMRSTNNQSCRCKICGKQFNALSNLRRHISMFHYRSKKFGCALCDYCAFRRYDIMNHLNFVHKLNTDSDATSKDLIRINDVPYTKDDMNEDIVLCSSEEFDEAEISSKSNQLEEKSQNELADQNSEILKLEKPTEKRQRRRHKNTLLTAVSNDSSVQKIIAHTHPENEPKISRQKLKRSQSQTTEAITTKNGAQKRPKRNCTKPVNKDFVYDMGALLKKEIPQLGGIAGSETACETYQLRGSKRRNTLNNHFEITLAVPAFDLIKVKHWEIIRGSARRSCLLLVNQGLAASSTLPEIPAERPQMRPRLTSTQRSDSQAGPIIETSELEAARLKSLPLCDDSYLEKITKESVGSFKIKPCLEQQRSALDSLLQKVDSSSKQLNGIAAKNEANQMNAHSTDETMKDAHNPFNFLSSSLLESGSNNNIALSSLPSYLITPEQAIPKTLSIPTKPQKRLPSMDRLNETINSLENFFNSHLKN